MLAAASPARHRLRNAYDLLAALTGRELRLRYQGSVFGWAWSLARPVALGLTLAFALGKVLAVGIDDYAVFLLAGLFPWFWFQASIQGSTTAFASNGGLLKKVRFPRAVLPLSIVFGQTLQFLLAVPVLLVFVLAYGYDPAPAWLIGIPTLFALQLALTAALALLIATATAYLRDLEHLTEVGLNLLFYLTPILYNADRVPERYRWMTDLNPIAPLAEGWRRVLLGGELPAAGALYALAVAALSGGLSWWLFRRLEGGFADVV